MSDSDLVICGTLGRDPELRFAKSGSAFVNFGLAVSRRWQQNGEWQEKTSWVDVAVFGQMAENVAQSLKKGDRAIVKGRLEMDEWQDKHSGDKRTKLKMVADEVGASFKWATAEVHRIQREQGDSARTSTARRPRHEVEDEPF